MNYILLSPDGGSHSIAARVWLYSLVISIPLAGFSGSTETAPAADLEEAVQALEERALERQARLEAALIQVYNFLI